MNRDELKALIRTEPSLQETFDTINAEYVPAVAHANSLELRLNELQLQLDAIAEAKREVAADVAEEEKVAAGAAKQAAAEAAAASSTGESASSDAPTDKTLIPKESDK